MPVRDRNGGGIANWARIDANNRRGTARESGDTKRFPMKKVCAKPVLAAEK